MVCPENVESQSYWPCRKDKRIVPKQGLDWACWRNSQTIKVTKWETCPFAEAVVDTKSKRQFGLRFSQRMGQISQQISSQSNIHCIPILGQENVARVPITKPFMMYARQDNVLRSTLGKNVGPIVRSVQSCIKAIGIFPGYAKLGVCVALTNLAISLPKSHLSLH